VYGDLGLAIPYPKVEIGNISRRFVDHFARLGQWSGHCDESHVQTADRHVQTADRHAQTADRQVQLRVPKREALIPTRNATVPTPRALTHLVNHRSIMLVALMYHDVASIARH